MKKSDLYFLSVVEEVPPVSFQFESLQSLTCETRIADAICWRYDILVRNISSIYEFPNIDISRKIMILAINLTISRVSGHFSSKE